MQHVWRLLMIPSMVGLAGCAGQTAGGPNCGPSVLKPGPGTAVPEIHGIANDGDAWMLVPAGYPAPSSIPIDVAFKLSAARNDIVNVSVGAAGFEPPGRVEAVATHVTPGWERPGREWSARLVFPRTGCFLVRAQSGEVTGSFAMRLK